MILVAIPVVPVSQSFSDTAAIGGLYAGYNWQFNSIVAGLELDANLSGTSKSVSAIGPIVFAPGTVRARSNFEGGLVAKVGVAFDNALLYVLGGASLADFSTRYNLGGPVQTFDNTRFGWTLGAGAAYKFTPNWSARVEYRYSDYGSQNDAVLAIGGNIIRHSLSTQRVMVGLTYQFGGPAGAVVAKY